MKFRVAREVLADAVAWTARSLPPRPSVPVLAGILLEVDGNQLSVSGFDYEVSARAEVDVQASEAGRALVPGRLLAEITRALPPAKQGVASAVNDLTRELGAAFGIALLGSSFNAGYRHEVGAVLDPSTDEVAAVVRDSPAAGTAAAK